MQHLQPNTTLQRISYNNPTISYNMVGLVMMILESFVTLHLSK